MTPGEWAAWAQALFGLATFGAACVAVRAAYDAPKRAAEFADRLRADGQRAEEDRRVRLNIFANLMQCRAQMGSPLAAASLNLIDVVFRDDKEVREAWQHFLLAVSERPYSGDRARERYLAIIEKMARSLGLSAEITVADVQHAYYPEGLGLMDQAAYFEARDKVNRFSSTPESQP